MVGEDREPDPRPRVPAVSRALTVLDDISRHGASSLAVLARRLGLPKSSLLGICQTLVEERLLAQDTAGRYGLGLAVVELAAASRQALPQLKLVGVTVQNTVNPFFSVELSGIQEAAAERGVGVVVRDAGQDLEAQAGHVEEFLAAEVDAIIVDAVNSVEIGRAVKSAQAEGVPVVAVNVGATGADATVTTDNVHAGQVVARYLAACLGGRGRIAVVDGLPVTAVSDRITGFLSALRDYPHISVAGRAVGDHSPSGGARATRRLLDQGPPPDAIFAINDPTAEGVIEALTDRGLTLPVGSVDGSADAARAIAARSSLVATAAQDPAALGGLAVALAADLCAGRTLHHRVRLLPARLVTADTVADYQPWGDS